MSELLAHPEVAALLAAPVASSSSLSSEGDNDSSSGGAIGSSASGSSSHSSSGGSSESQQQLPAKRPKLAFVFGREVEGLLPAEVDACNFTLSIPIGRLQGAHWAAALQTGTTR